MAYDLEWRLLDDVGNETLIEDIADEFYDLSGLAAHTDYEFRVRETDGSSDSAWSSWFTFKTQEEKVTGLTVDDNQAPDLEFSWNPVPDCTYSRAFVNEEGVVVATNSGMTSPGETVSGDLSPYYGTVCSYRVQAVNTLEGVSSWEFAEVFFEVLEPTTGEAVALSAEAASADSWAAQVHSAVTLASAATASDYASAVAAVNLSIIEVAQASDLSGDTPIARVSMGELASGNATLDAFSTAAAALSAGAMAAESWTVQAQVLVDLIEQGAASDEIRRQTESAISAALEAQSQAADQFLSALEVVASLSDSATVADAFQAVVLQLASIASGAIGSDSFRMIFGLQRAFYETAVAESRFGISYSFVQAMRSGGITADAWAVMANLNAALTEVCSVSDLMTARAGTVARLASGAVASSRFVIVNAGVQYMIMGAVILRDALMYTVGDGPALGQSVTTRPALNTTVKIKPGH